jgi:hypothetical protein
MKRLLPASLFTAPRSDTAGPFELPSDVARESRRRVQIAAAIGALAYGVFLLVELSGVLGATALEGTIDLTHDLLGLGLCVALLLISMLPPIGDRTVLGLALAFEVMLCVLISIAVPWAGYLRTAHVGSLTWVVPVIILFPLLVPARPITSIGISILCALTMPAGLWWLSMRGAIVAHGTEVLATAIGSAGEPARPV